ncbi:hypothetical protein EVAR_93570_1 [Eumeta japonica]|uniref:Uncharacterized protein n=1 Tax=Eumeta variegata TaxID=151549 RepID=A0A4C1UR48_EUMVA|nr:hypothetical protein EVAR_93570_1 [Eumeta japonica]
MNIIRLASEVVPEKLSRVSYSLSRASFEYSFKVTRVHLRGAPSTQKQVFESFSSSRDDVIVRANKHRKRRSLLSSKKRACQPPKNTYMVTAAHEHSQSRTTQQYIAEFLGRDRISDGWELG